MRSNARTWASTAMANWHRNIRFWASDLQNRTLAALTRGLCSSLACFRMLFSPGHGTYTNIFPPCHKESRLSLADHNLLIYFSSKAVVGNVGRLKYDKKIICAIFHDSFRIMYHMRNIRTIFASPVDFSHCSIRKIRNGKGRNIGFFCALVHLMGSCQFRWNFGDQHQKHVGS